MNQLLAPLEAAILETPAGELPALIGELERCKTLAWQRLLTGYLGGLRQGVQGQTLLTIPELAAQLNIPESRAYELVRRQSGFPVIKIGKYLRVSPEALDEWLATRAQPVLDSNVSATYTSQNGRVRTPKAPQRPRIDAGTISRASGCALEFDRTPGAGRDRHSGIASPPRSIAGAE